MTKRTPDKYREAGFFLDKTLSTDDKDEMRYYLSAFLSAARSTTWVLEREYDEEPEFEEWYSEKQKWMKNDPLFRILKEYRNHVVKTTTVTPSDGVIDVHVDETPEKHISITITSEKGSQYFFQSLPEDVYVEVPDDIESQYHNQYAFTPLEELCRKYLNKIDQIITEWENKN